MVVRFSRFKVIINTAQNTTRQAAGDCRTSCNIPLDTSAGDGHKNICRSKQAQIFLMSKHMGTKIPSTDFNVPWSQAVWLNPPPQSNETDDNLVVTTGADTDFWRVTSYGFIHDNGHALLTDLSDGRAVEVTFKALLESQFDQAGLMVRIDSHNWIKAGVEFSDGIPQLGAVVTREMSDWSVAPATNWNDGSNPVTVRVSRSGNALTVRAKLGNEPWQFVRLTSIDPTAKMAAGPMACSPTRGGLQVRFTKFALGPSDLALHD